MTRYIATLFFASSSLFCFAQKENNQFIRRGLLRADASFAPGYMFNGRSNVYMNGNLEYYLDSKTSIRGDANYMFGSKSPSSDSMSLKDNHSLMIGLSLHVPTKGSFDPYFIVQPGLAYTSSAIESRSSSDAINKKTFAGVLTPVASAGIGFNYYFQRFAHLFMEGRYYYANHLSAAPAPISLQEVRVTFGLGFNVFVIKKRPAI
jgi:hypothetical protein